MLFPPFVLCYQCGLSSRVTLGTRGTNSKPADPPLVKSLTTAIAVGIPYRRYAQPCAAIMLGCARACTIRGRSIPASGISVFGTAARFAGGACFSGLYVYLVF